jgi:hypothetical protein
VLRTDWLYGGDFVDYRNPHDLTDSCDPLRSWVGIEPTYLALTSWSQGGWNDDWTNVLVYDTARNAIGVWEGEDWVHYRDEHDPYEHYYDHTGVGLFNHSMGKPLAVLSKGDWECNIWLDAPTLLKRMLHAYQSLAWTPWETSNREDGWGVHVETIRDLSRRNGWPTTFDPNRFNADFIRAKHASLRRRGSAEAAHRIMEELEGTEESGPGGIEGTRQQLKNFETQVKLMHHDEQEHWYWVFRTQEIRWSLSRLEEDLLAAKNEIQRLCPDGMCVKPEDQILWEFHSLEASYNKAQRAKPPEVTCERDLANWKDWAPIPDRQGNCVVNRQREKYWLELAYSQARTEAEAHCAASGSDLVLQLTLEELVHSQIAHHESEITRAQSRAVEMYAWLPTLPEHAEKARNFFERQASAVHNGNAYRRKKIDGYEKDLVGGDDGKGRERLWKCLDDEGWLDLRRMV